MTTPHTFFQKGMSFSTKKAPAASLKRSKHGLGKPKHAFSKKGCAFFSKQKETPAALNDS